MERPYHMHASLHHPHASRVVLLGLAFVLPASILWALTHGLGTAIIEHTGPLVFVREKDPVKPKSPPLPPLTIEKMHPITAVPPIITIAPPVQGSDTRSVAVTPPIAPPTTSVAPGPDRAAAGIASTHTTPPYPLLEQRMGVEGKVTLRLTVLPDGKVGSADIVTSSGRTAFDQAAREWIVAHWLYKPALAKGQPVTGEAIATVIFNLDNQR